MDPVTLQLYRHRFAGVAEEMGVTLRRTAYSPNIKERLDFSCAVFDGASLLREGRKHSIYQCGNVKTQIPRHVEIVDQLARKICKDLGIPFVR